MRIPLMTALRVVVMIVAVLGARASAQAPGSPPRVPQRGGVEDWPLHNLDLHNSRYSPLEKINVSNADRLAVKWTFSTDKSEGIGSVTPVVVNGVMYFNAGSKLFAVDAA